MMERKARLACCSLPQPKSNSQSDWSEAGSLRDNLGDQLAIHVGQPHIPAVEKVS
jgi:hypothetical protein